MRFTERYKSIEFIDVSEIIYDCIETFLVSMKFPGIVSYKIKVKSCIFFLKKKMLQRSTLKMVTEISNSDTSAMSYDVQNPDS